MNFFSKDIIEQLYNPGIFFTSVKDNLIFN